MSRERKNRALRNTRDLPRGNKIKFAQGDKEREREGIQWQGRAAKDSKLNKRKPDTSNYREKWWSWDRRGERVRGGKRAKRKRSSRRVDKSRGETRKVALTNCDVVLQPLLGDPCSRSLLLAPSCSFPRARQLFRRLISIDVVNSASSWPLYTQGFPSP